MGEQKKQGGPRGPRSQRSGAMAMQNNDRGGRSANRIKADRE